jgi:hypothetical protein
LFYKGFYLGTTTLINGMPFACILSIVNFTKDKIMSSILTDLSNEVVKPGNQAIMNEDQILEMYLEHLKSLMIQMIDNGLLHVEK